MIGDSATGHNLPIGKEKNTEQDIKAEMSNRELTDHIELTYGTPKDGQVKFKTYYDAADEEEMAKKVDNTFKLMDTLKKANRIPE